MLSTLPAIGTLILGLLAGRWIAQEPRWPRRIAGLLGAGLAAMIAGLIWDLWLPINKNLWTSAYVLFTGGLASLLLAGFMALVDLRPLDLVDAAAAGLRRQSNPGLFRFRNNGDRHLRDDPRAAWRQAGRHPGMDLRCRSGLVAARTGVASLAFALLFVAAWYGILRVFYRRGIILKV